MPRLTLLDDVTWDGRPLPGGRVVDLLAALALLGRRGGSDADLVGRLWDAPPAGGAKALQVVVTRARTATAPGSVLRTAAGYRFADDVAVDAWLLDELIAGAPTTADRDLPALLDRAPQIGPADGEGPLPLLRRHASRHRVALELVVGAACSRLGRHEAALDLLQGHDPGDEAVLEPMLRSVAAVHGTAAALDRYEKLRTQLADRLGVDPSPALRDLHAELLAADAPVRTGVVAPRTTMLGRDADLAAVRAALATSRVVTVLGAGGLGKTTLAQTVARTSALPVVHVVPLVAVVDPDHVVGAVAAALGARESVSERRDRTEVRSALNGRIAAQLTGPPTLLVLDNCEQVVDAVADLVGQLVAAVPKLTVLATSRSPLQLASERIVPLGALSDADAAELFRSRAEAVRPGVELPDAAVREIVTRLDGVPLALELAAAQIRRRSVAEIVAGLDARFDLLRGGLRDVPDRHRTLLAVIDWSWQLLDPVVQGALGRFSVFQNAFGRASARSVLGAGSDDALDTLVDHSLLLFDETDGAVRFRMLETVREFGAGRLAATGDTDAARRAVRDWAVDLIAREEPFLGTGAEIAAVRRLLPDLPELAEVLRRALADRDVATALAVGPALGELWLLRGDRSRIGALVEIGHLIAQQPEHEAAQEDPARAALSMAILAESFLAGEPATATRARLAELGPGDRPVIAGAVRVALVPLDDNHSPALAGLLEIAHGEDAESARQAWLWATFVLENQGDFAGAVEASRRAVALMGPDPAASAVAMMLSVQAQLLANQGETDAAVEPARQALSLFERLRSDEDAAEMQALLAMIELTRGRIDAVRRQVADWPETGLGGGASGSILPRWVLAELALREGDSRTGLAGYLSVLADADSWFPPQEGMSFSPWTIGALMAATTAHARWTTDPSSCRWLYDRAVVTAQGLLDQPRLDFPLTGSLAFSIAAWNLLVLDEIPDAVLTLLALARRFGHGLALPTWPWADAESHVVQRRPDRWQEIADRIGAVPLTQLREELGRALAQLNGSHILRA